MRLIIVSNRLPVTLVKQGEQLISKQSIGGLATGLQALFKKSFVTHYSQKPYLWVGWPGLTVRQAQQESLRKQLATLHCKPIFIHNSLMNKFLDGFCNKVLWPIFHYFSAYYQYEEDFFTVYQKVNKKFAKEIAAIIQPGDVVWIHDYHLLLLPQLLRKQFPQLTMGFFLHTPFPCYEILQVFPRACREAILQGILGADLIGFHIHQYAEAFKIAIGQTFGYEQHANQFIVEGRKVKVDVFPMSVDYKSISKKARQSSSQTNHFSMLKNQKIILSADRLDYTKGILSRLRAYHKFLHENPHWCKKVMLLLLVAPSREAVSHYQYMKQQIDESVGLINGKFAEIDWMPILYQYRTFTLDEFIQIYTLSDVALITPLRDGMNLVAKEYVSSRIHQNGVLILSETAGAARELVDALIVNPFSIDNLTQSLHQALTMEISEQAMRMANMQKYLKTHDVSNWGRHFLDDLLTLRTQQSPISASSFEKLKPMFLEFNKAKKRLILLDYDGTLAPFTPDPKKAYPSEKLLTLLYTLASNPHNRVAIISGRDKDILEKWLGHLELILTAEHGVWMKVNQHWELNYELDRNWKKNVLPIFCEFTEKVSGTFIEEKEYSIAWHYRGADHPQEGEQWAKLLEKRLTTELKNVPIRILMGNKVVEVLCANIGKDAIVTKLMADFQHDFIMAIGDDVTDEDMFSALPETAYSIKVGPGNTLAKFTINTQAEAVQLLARLAALS